MMQPPQYAPAYAQQQQMVRPKRVNCFKPLVGCTLGPVVLLFSIFGCMFVCLAIFSARGPQPPLEDFEPDATAAALYEQNTIDALSRAVAQSGDSTFVVQIEQEAFSSWLNLEYEALFERYEITQPQLWDYVDPIFQIRFANGQILFYAANDLPLATTGLLVTAEAAPPQTEFTTTLVDIDIVKIEAAGFSLEDDSATLSANLAELLTDRLEDYRQSAGVNAIVVTAIASADGILTIQGRVSP